MCTCIWAAAIIIELAHKMTINFAICKSMQHLKSLSDILSRICFFSKQLLIFQKLKVITKLRAYHHLAINFNFLFPEGITNSFPKQNVSSNSISQNYYIIFYIDDQDNLDEEHSQTLIKHYEL